MRNSQYRAQEITRADYEERAAPHGAIFVGSPQQIIDKILYECELFGHQRFLAQIDIGGLPFVEVPRVIELFAVKVAPVVRGAVAKANRPLDSAEKHGRPFGQPA